jgi:LppX/LprAFG-like lipoprotein
MRRMLAALTLGAVLGACSIGEQPPDPAQVLNRAASVLALVHTVNANVKFTKAPITFQGFTLVGARTAIVLPGESDTQFTVKQGDISIGIQVLISNGTYLRLPFSNFQRLTDAQAAEVPDISKLFHGLPLVIPNGTSTRYVSTEQIDGKETYKITTVYSAEQVHSLLDQLNSSGPVNATIWVDKSSSAIRKAVLDGAFGDGGLEASVEVVITQTNGTVILSSPTP